MEENRFLNKPEVKVSLYLLPFWRYKRFNISGCELSTTTSGHRIDSGEVLFESSYPNNLGKSFQTRPTKTYPESIRRPEVVELNSQSEILKRLFPERKVLETQNQCQAPLVILFESSYPN